ncbi:hypothetical protein AX15_005337, partial [Amanita polypyramis BW_CC]
MPNMASCAPRSQTAAVSATLLYIHPSHPHAMQRQSHPMTVNDHNHQHHHHHQRRFPRDPKCCGLVDDVKYHVKTTREIRGTKPQPWIVLKLMVFVTIGIMGYAAYVYVGRLCVPFVVGRRGRRGAGIVLLIVFVILFCWMVWSYLK